MSSIYEYRSDIVLLHPIWLRMPRGVADLRVLHNESRPIRAATSGGPRL